MSMTIDSSTARAVDEETLLGALEHYWDKEWTDGLPVVPVTESYLAEFLATVDRDPGEILFTITHLNRHMTVRLA
nr:hypothetical protein [Actinomycetota bacterium]